MKRTEPESARDVLMRAIAAADMESRLAERKAIAAFAAAAGQGVASQCGHIRVARGVMYISVPSAPLRQELSMMTSSLLEHVNAAAGRDVIKALRFVS